MADGSVNRGTAGAEETASEVRLWQAVVVRAIEDWMSGPLRQKRMADQYIFGPNTDFGRVCESAGLNAEHLRARLGKIRSRHSREDRPVAA